jgi:hypothetical protein
MTLLLVSLSTALASEAAPVAPTADAPDAGPHAPQPFNPLEPRVGGLLLGTSRATVTISTIWTLTLASTYAWTLAEGADHGFAATITTPFILGVAALPMAATALLTVDLMRDTDVTPWLLVGAGAAWGFGVMAWAAGASGGSDEADATAFMGLVSATASSALVLAQLVLNERALWQAQNGLLIAPQPVQGGAGLSASMRF